MHPSDSLTADLARLTGAIDNPDVDLDRQLRAVVDAAESAVASYLGMTLTIVVDGGQPVSVTARTERSSEIGTSLHIPLTVESSADSASTLTLYAAAPGAFVDLGADLGYALRLPSAALVFDEHLSAPAGGSGVTGRDTQSVLNQAIGVLIERGSTPSVATQRLRLLADGDVGVRVIAERVVRSAIRTGRDH